MAFEKIADWGSTQAPLKDMSQASNSDSDGSKESNLSDRKHLWKLFNACKFSPMT